MRWNWLRGLLALAAVSGLLWGLRGGALWEPHELTVAEQARRIALNLLGDTGLTLPGGDNSVPIRADLGRGELPLTSVALGFRVFGLRDWAGRLPLLLWALTGAAVLYAAAARLWDRRTGCYVVLVLATTPAYFLQARTLLGDAVTLANFAIAWSGLATATLSVGLSTRTRAGFAAIGALGLYAGFWCRGPLVSVAVPALSVGLVAWTTRPAAGRLARGVVIAATLLGALALVAGLWALHRTRASAEYSVLVGSAIVVPSQLPSFVGPLAALAHACFPWSALAPLAFLLPWDSADDVKAASARAALLSLGASLAASAWAAPHVGPAALPGLPCFALLIAFGLRTLEQVPGRVAVLAGAIGVLAVVLGFDLRSHPDKALAGLGLQGVSLPEALVAPASKLWTISGLALALASLLCLYERQADGAASRRFDRAEYAGVLAKLQRVWDGNLVFALLLLEATLVGFLLLSAFNERLALLPQLDDIGSFWRDAVAVLAVAVPLSALVPLTAMLLRDLGRAFFGGAWLGRWRAMAPTRAQGLLATGVAIGAGASLAFYPAVSRQLSPKEVFERYHELARRGEPLGVLGRESAALRYQAGPPTAHFETRAAAASWLLEAASAPTRRWLLLHKSDLPELNATFRRQHLGNLPILDARSSEVLLASNRRERAERDQNPLAPYVLDAAPVPQHPLHALLGQRQLQVLGYSLTSADGRPELSLRPATHYRLTVYFRVLARIEGDWRAFVHIDGLQRRFNADHELTDGKYPLELWSEDDVIADSTEIVLEPSFSPGTYRLYLGLFDGDRRLEVGEGLEQDDRIVAGTVEIR